MKIELKEVKSSNILAIGYDKDSKILHVKFVGNNVYEYSAVPTELFEAFSGSESKGKFFAANVRGKFQYVKLEKEQAA
jgi:hypothetical protein